ncbi:MAG: hypothetical protein ABR968_09380 [Bacteroidales bacterium]|jgi:hypothetical protein
MPGNTNIPRDIKTFNSFINQTNSYLILGTPINAVRFGWTAAQLTAWQGFLSAWSPKYLLYSDRKAGYTTDNRNDLEIIISNVISYDKVNKLINKVKATSNLTSQDCSTFRISQSLAVPPTGMHPVAKNREVDKTIATPETVYPKLFPLAGGVVHIKVYPTKAASGRAHKLKGYDLVEYAVGVFYSGASGLPTVASDTRLTISHSSKASFLLPTVSITTNLTALAAGTLPPAKIALLFFRWAKSKHPDLDGIWNGPFTTPLM